MGYLNLRPEQTNIFFKLMEERYRRRASIITTSLDYDDWLNFLGNKHMVTALLSRLRHQCTTIRIDGPSPPRTPGLASNIDLGTSSNAVGVASITRTPAVPDSLSGICSTPGSLLLTVGGQLLTSVEAPPLSNRSRSPSSATAVRLEQELRAEPEVYRGLPMSASGSGRGMSGISLRREYVEPAKQGFRAYPLLREALRESGRVGTAPSSFASGSI
jgi:IstB-like ATP binding protein